MSLVKEIHSDVLRNQLHPDDGKFKQHYFLCGIHSAAATVGRYKERGEQLDKALKQMTDLIAEVDSGQVTQDKWAETIASFKASVNMAKEALGLGIVTKPPIPIVEDLTVEEILDLQAYPSHTFASVFEGLWQVDSMRRKNVDDSEYFKTAAETLLKSLKDAGYVRILK